MAGLTGTDPDVAPDLTLPTTAMETEEREIQDSSAVRPGTATAGALIPPPPVHHRPRAAR